MRIKKIHYPSGLIIAAFVGIHLVNHLYSIYGADQHIALMNILRGFYRNLFVESLLLTAVGVQIISGIMLFRSKQMQSIGFFEKVQVWSGLYLAFFLVIHVTAVMAGRFILNLDTNFYFGVAGINSFPVNLFFIPYYALAILSFFGHLASIHAQKMKANVLGIAPQNQSVAILGIGIIITFVVFWGLTNHFSGITIPAEYQIFQSF